MKTHFVPLLFQEFKGHRTCHHLGDVLPIQVEEAWSIARGMSNYGLAIYILRQKKNYRNSNVSPCKNIIFLKSFE
jgi:hypothetical protein